MRPTLAHVALVSFHLLLALVITPAHADICKVVPPYHRFVVVRLVVDTRDQWLEIETSLAEICKVTVVVGDAVIPRNPAFVAMLPEQVVIVKRFLKKGESSLRSSSKSMVTIQGRLDEILDNSPGQIQQYNGAVHQGRMQTTFYRNYWTYQALMQKWEELDRDYEQVTRERIGSSLMGNEIPVLRIGNTDEQNPRRLVITALLHAREWIATSVATYLVERLAVSMVKGGDEEDEQIASILEHTEVVIVPMVNPDGYVYSNTFRLQRKNRRETTCARATEEGVDLNRNWSKEWGPIDASGNDPCNEDYIGQNPFSEPEAVAVRDLIEGLSGIESHIDFHSFGEYVLSPWSYADTKPNNYEEFCRVGKAVARNMSRSSAQNYQFGPAAAMLYKARGVISDWMADRGVLSFTVELRPSAIEEPIPAHGFALATEEIEPTCKESWSGVKVLLRHEAGRLDGLAACRERQEAEPEEIPASNVDVLFVTGVSIGGALFVGMVAIIITMAVRNRRRQKAEESWYEQDSLDTSETSMPRLPKPVYRKHGRGMMYDR